MVAPDSERHAPAAGKGGLYTTFVPSPDPFKERILDGLAHVLRVVRPTFVFEGRTYRYFLHPYNRTMRGERCVEVPIVMEHVRVAEGRRVLEVGNVLRHYFPLSHTVIDKYETAAGIVNADVVDYRPESPFDLVVSISTLEHVGWDEDPREPEKLLPAIDNLVSRCLAPGGKLVMTAPVGYNAFLDEAVAAGRLGLTSAYWLRRRSRWAHWEQCRAEDVRAVRYNTPHPFANALLVGIVEKPLT